MRVDRAGLLHFFARRVVLVHAIDVKRTRIVERDEDVLRWYIRRHVDRPRGQTYRFAVLRERPGRRIDAQRRDVMLRPGFAVSRCAAARCNVKKAFGNMRPGVLHTGRQAYGASLRQRRIFDVHVIVREVGTDVGIERNFAHVRPFRCRVNQR